jgi:hypothetical protein
MQLARPITMALALSSCVWSCRGTGAPAPEALEIQEYNRERTRQLDGYVVEATTEAQFEEDGWVVYPNSLFDYGWGFPDIEDRRRVRTMSIVGTPNSRTPDAKPREGVVVRISSGTIPEPTSPVWELEFQDGILVRKDVEERFPGDIDPDVVDRHMSVVVSSRRIE